jgi:uncharacterized protein
VGHVETVRASYAAFESGDRDAAFAVFSDDVEWHQAQGLPHGGVYHGMAEVRRNVFDPIGEAWWETFSAVPLELIDAGHDVVVLGRYAGRALRTGKLLDVPFAHVWSFDGGGKVVRFVQHVDTQGWNDALSPA